MIEAYSMPCSTIRTLMDANGREIVNEFIIGPGLNAANNSIDKVHIASYERNHVEALNTEVSFVPAMMID